MKFAHTTPYFHPEYYGSHEAFLSAELVARGHQVTIFTSDRMPRWGGAKGLEEKLEVGTSEWRGVRIVRMPAGPTVSFVPSMPALAGHLRQEQYDLFLSHEVFSLAAWHTARVAQKADRPFVLVQHGYTGGRRPLFKLLFSLEFQALGRRVLEAADRVVTLTEAGRTFLEGLGADTMRCEVIPTGVESGRFTPMPKRANGNLRFGYLGRIDADKGVFALLDAFRRSLRTLGPSTNRLIFAGAGDDEADLQQQVQRWGLSDHVEFAGRLAHASVPAFLQSLDALVIPTLQSEPFGIVAVEAGAAGIPVLASRLGGLAETVVNGVTGRLFEPGNVVELSDLLTDATRNSYALPNLGQAARQHIVAGYDWQNVTGRFEELFASLVDGGLDSTEDTRFPQGLPKQAI